jgi:hypothetical protein
MFGEYYYPLANALFILTLSFAYQWIFLRKAKIWQTGVLLLLLSASYIYGMVTAVIIILLCVLFLGFKQKRLFLLMKQATFVFLFCAPVIIYYVWLLSQYPEINDSSWYSTPPFTTIFCTMGLVLVFSVLRLGFRWRFLKNEDTFLAIWAVASLALIYIPGFIASFHLMLLIGIKAPLCIMAVLFLRDCINFITKKIKLPLEKRSLQHTAGSAIFLTFILISALTNIHFYIQQLYELRARSEPYYIEKPIYDAMAWCSVNISPEKLVVTNKKLAFLFSGITACRVYSAVASFDKNTEHDKQMDKLLKAMLANNQFEAGSVLKSMNANYFFLENSMTTKEFESLRTFFKRNYKEIFSNAQVSVIQLN